MNGMNGNHEAGGARLLLTDAKVVSLLLRDARDRTTARLFGTTSDQSLLITALALGSLAAAVHEKGTAILGVRPSPSADTLIGAGVMNVALHGIAGAPSRDKRFLAALVTFAVLGSSFGPAVAGSIRGLRAEGHRIGSAMRGRYGGNHVG
jgi:hypothetical protein